MGVSVLGICGWCWAHKRAGQIAQDNWHAFVLGYKSNRIAIILLALWISSFHGYILQYRRTLFLNENRCCRPPVFYRISTNPNPNPTMVTMYWMALCSRFIRFESNPSQRTLSLWAHQDWSVADTCCHSWLLSSVSYLIQHGWLRTLSPATCYAWQDTKDAASSPQRAGLMLFRNDVADATPRISRQLA